MNSAWNNKITLSRLLGKPFANGGAVIGAIVRVGCRIIYSFVFLCEMFIGGSSFSLSLVCKWVCLLLLWTDAQMAISSLSNCTVRDFFTESAGAKDMDHGCPNCLYLNKSENFGWGREVSGKWTGGEQLWNQGFPVAGTGLFLWHLFLPYLFQYCLAVRMSVLPKIWVWVFGCATSSQVRGNWWPSLIIDAKVAGLGVQPVE